MSISDTRATFVLVHGAHHGGWCWKKLAPLLRASGHEVFTPTLSGCGDRAHLASPDVGLDTHVTDIAALLEYEDLREVVLVGHSSGGMVIAGCAAKAQTRITRLIYLDAFMPDDGKAVADYVPLPPLPDGEWLYPARSPEDFGVTNPLDIAWMKTRLTDMPRKCMTQPVHLSAEATRRIKGAFIQCTQAPFFAEAADRAKRQGLQVRPLLSAGHDAMVTEPEALASLLLELAEDVEYRQT